MSDKLPTKIILREYSESLLIAVCLALFLRFFVISAYKIPTGSMSPTLKTGDFVFTYKLAYGVAIPFGGGSRFGFTYPERGDVVVFRFPGNETINYVKRVVGLPGDHIVIKNKKLFINERESNYEPASGEIIKDLPGHEDDKVVRESFPNISAPVLADQVGSVTASPAAVAPTASGESAGHFIMTSNLIGADAFGPIVVAPGQVFVLGDNRDSSDDSRYWGTVPVGNLEGRVILVWMSFDWLDRWASERLPSVRWERVLRAVR